MRSRKLAREIEARIKRDRAFVRDPFAWPMFPLLPVVCRDGSVDPHDRAYCGVLLARGGRPPRAVVYYTNLVSLVMLGHTTDGPPDWPQVFRELQHREFASLDELVEVYRVD